MRLFCALRHRKLAIYNELMGNRGIEEVGYYRKAHDVGVRPLKVTNGQWLAGGLIPSYI